MDQSDVDFLLQVDLQEGFHEQFDVVDFVALGVVNQHVALLGLFLHADDFLAQSSQLCRVVSDSTKSVKGCLTIETLAGNIV